MELEELRKKIDVIDQEMLKLFEERMNLAYQIGQIKKERKLPILDSDREKEVINRNITLLKNQKLIPLYIKFITNLMNLSKEFEE